MVVYLHMYWDEFLFCNFARFDYGQWRSRKLEFQAQSSLTLTGPLLSQDEGCSIGSPLSPQTSADLP